MNYRISVVSYINTLPFIHGITNSLFSDNLESLANFVLELIQSNTADIPVINQVIR